MQFAAELNVVKKADRNGQSAEVAAIPALGLQRVFARQSSRDLPDNPDNCLPNMPQQSRDARLFGEGDQGGRPNERRNIAKGEDA
jgi:hypothetical protein